jgi:hypothetical protein
MILKMQCDTEENLLSTAAGFGIVLPKLVETFGGSGFLTLNPVNKFVLLWMGKDSTKPAQILAQKMKEAMKKAGADFSCPFCLIKPNKQDRLYVALMHNQAQAEHSLVELN